MARRGRKRVNPKLIIGVLVVIGIMFFGYFQFSDYIEDIWPNLEKIDSAKKRLKKKQQKLQKLLNESQKIKMNHNAFIKYAKRFWIEKRDGDPRTNAQRKVEQAAKSAGLNLNTVGRVQSNKIMEGVYSMEISVNTKTSVEQLSKFLRAVYSANPRFYWYRLTLRPDSLRKPSAVMLSGSLRFIEITDPEIADMILR